MDSKRTVADKEQYVEIAIQDPDARIFTGGRMNLLGPPAWKPTINYPQIGYIATKFFHGSGVLFKIPGQENLFLTAGHCLLIKKDEDKFVSSGGITVRFNYHHGSAGNPTDGEEFSVLEVVTSVYNKKYDYAILRLSGNPSAKYGSYELSLSEPAPGMSVEVVHHPDGVPKQISKGKIVEAAEAKGGKFAYALDTEEGSSGAPIIYDGKIIGVHTNNNSANKSNLGFSIKYLSEHPDFKKLLSPKPVDKSLHTAAPHSANRSGLYQEMRSQKALLSATTNANKALEIVRNKAQETESGTGWCPCPIL